MPDTQHEHDLLRRYRYALRVLDVHRQRTDTASFELSHAHGTDRAVRLGRALERWVEDMREILVHRYEPIARAAGQRMAHLLGASNEHLPEHGRSQDELESAAAFGLMQAIDEFDAPAHGRFPDHAAQRCWEAMVEELTLGQDPFPRQPPAADD